MDPELTKICLEKFQREIERSPVRAFLSGGFTDEAMAAMECRLKQGLVLLDHAREFPTGRKITGLGSINADDFKRCYRFFGIDRAGVQPDDEKDALTLAEHAIRVDNIRGISFTSAFIDDPCAPPELELVFVGYDPQKG